MYEVQTQSVNPSAAHLRQVSAFSRLSAAAAAKVWVPTVATIVSAVYATCAVRCRHVHAFQGSACFVSCEQVQMQMIMLGRNSIIGIAMYNLACAGYVSVPRRFHVTRV